MYVFQANVSIYTYTAYELSFSSIVASILLNFALLTSFFNCPGLFRMF